MVLNRTARARHRTDRRPACPTWEPLGESANLGQQRCRARRVPAHGSYWKISPSPMAGQLRAHVPRERIDLLAQAVQHFDQAERDDRLGFQGSPRPGQVARCVATATAVPCAISGRCSPGWPASSPTAAPTTRPPAFSWGSATGSAAQSASRASKTDRPRRERRSPDAHAVDWPPPRTSRPTAGAHVQWPASPGSGLVWLQ